MRPGAGPYEAWAVTLRAWEVDPSTSLVDLPVITETSFDPATFGRLMERIHEAQTAFMQKWSEGMSASIGRSRTHYEMARELVAARARLRPRVDLVTHAGLPQPVRTALWEGLTTDLHNLQQQLEEAAIRNDEAARTDRAAADRLLLVMRENSMTALLARDRSPGAPPSARRIVPS